MAPASRLGALAHAARARRAAVSEIPVEGRMATGSMIGFPERSAIGAISGTSMDGIDVAFLKTDGTRVARTGLGKSYPYPDALRRELLAFLRDPSLAERDPLAQLEAKVTEAHVQAVALFMREFQVRTWTSSACTARPSGIGPSGASPASSSTACTPQGASGSTW
jgi:hypothetical protein